MSDKDKTNSGSDHDHDHDHGHGHDHDHSHGHDHSHSHGVPDRSDEIEALIQRKKVADDKDEPLPPSNDDANTQALSTALDQSFKIVKVVMALMVIAFLCSGIFTVQQNEVAVILRAGKPVGDTAKDQVLGPGLHFAFPYPIDEIVHIPLGQSHTVVSTTGWPALSPEQEIKGDMPVGVTALKPGVDGYTLTSDGNIIHVRATLKYRIVDPVRYEFEFAGVTNLIINALNNAILYASANYKAEDAIYKDKTGFKEKVRDRVVSLINQSKYGIELEPINVETSAPLNVRPSFNAVQESDLDRNKKINEALGDADKVVREASGESQAIVSAGYTSSTQNVQTVSAQANKFLALLPRYETDPEFFRQRLLTEKMQVILANAQDKFFLPSRADGAKRELRLQLNPEPPAPKPNR